MMRFNWDRICVLVVDDNAFMVQLLISTLKSLGMENAVGESNCANAIERLKLSNTDPIGANLGEVDLILSDYLMPGVDGNLFLRWIRTGDDVPDRFVPFVMVSGAADRHVVEAARDAGVTEFLAKPYSAKSLADRILTVVNNPRQYILCKGYFGPDRRRTKVAVEQDRRKSKASEIQMLKAGTDIRTIRDDARAVHFQPDNRLRKKLIPRAMAAPVEFDPQLIRAAEKRIQELVGDYADWVRKYIRSMSEAQAALKTGRAAQQSNKKHIANINRIAHELRGQGGTFDYPLVTSFGRSLYEATMDPNAVVSEGKQKLIAAHIDAIKTVFNNRIKGDGGEVGAALLQDIRLAVKKYA